MFMNYVHDAFDSWTMFMNVHRYSTMIEQRSWTFTDIVNYMRMLYYIANYWLTWLTISIIIDIIIPLNRSSDDSLLSMYVIVINWLLITWI